MDEDEELECGSCQGTGIGDPHLDTRCSVCKGTGVILPPEEREYEEPDYQDDPAADFIYDPHKYNDRKYD